MNELTVSKLIPPFSLRQLQAEFGVRRQSLQQASQSARAGSRWDGRYGGGSGGDERGEDLQVREKGVGGG